MPGQGSGGALPVDEGSGGRPAPRASCARVSPFDWAQGKSFGGAQARSSTAASAQQARRLPRRRLGRWAAVVALGLTAVAAGASWLARGRGEDTDAGRTSDLAHSAVDVLGKHDRRRHLAGRQVSRARRSRSVPRSRCGFAASRRRRPGAHSARRLRLLRPAVFPRRAIGRLLNPRPGLCRGPAEHRPAYGGTPRVLLSTIMTAVTFSPDGRQMAFLRSEYPDGDSSALLVANADGTGERVLATRRTPESFAPTFFPAASWSPDGALIVASVRNLTTRRSQLIGFDARTGSERVLHSSTDNMTFTLWQPDGEGILFVARSFEPYPGPPAQLWRLPYPSGVAHQVTRDLLDYRSLSISVRRAHRDGCRRAVSGRVALHRPARRIGAAAHPVRALRRPPRRRAAGRRVGDRDDHHQGRNAARSHRAGWTIAHDPHIARQQHAPGGITGWICRGHGIQPRWLRRGLAHERRWQRPAPPRASACSLVAVDHPRWASRDLHVVPHRAASDVEGADRRRSGRRDRPRPRPRHRLAGWQVARWVLRTGGECREHAAGGGSDVARRQRPASRARHAGRRQQQRAAHVVEGRHQHHCDDERAVQPLVVRRCRAARRAN